MEQLFNKNGITVKNTLRAIQEELLRGTGFVMWGKVSVRLTIQKAQCQLLSSHRLA